MKKYCFLSILMMLASLFIFTSCGQKPSYSGHFSKDEYVYSVNENESVNFFDELSLKGVSKKDVDIVISSDIAEKSENGFVMKKPGKALITAFKGETLFASSTLIVREKFDAPTYATVNDDGIVEWNGLNKNFLGQIYSPSGYILKINDEDEITVYTNRYDLKQGENAKGRYTLKIKALADGIEYIDESDFNEEPFIINYGGMEDASDFKVETLEGLNASNMATLTWKAIADANYDVYISGIKVATNISENKYSIDFSNVKDSQDIDVTIVVNDNRDLPESEKKFSSEKKITITKLPNIAPNGMDALYTKENGQAYIKWIDNENASSFVVYYANSNNQSEEFELPKDTLEVRDGFVYTKLKDLPFGVYQLRVQAKGGNIESEDGNVKYFADSNITEVLGLGKLATPEINYSFDEENLIISLPEDDYVEDYQITVNDTIKKANIKEKEVKFALSNFELGQLKVSMIALPKFNNDGNPIPFEVQGMRGDKILASDEGVNEQILFNIAKTDNIKHQLKEDGSSVLTFDLVDNTLKDDYKIYINDTLVEDFEIKDLPQTNQLEVTIPNLTNYEPSEMDYNFKVVACRTDGTSNSTSQIKRVSILGKTTKTDSQNGYFAWNSLGNDYDEYVEYYYKVTKSDKDKTIKEDKASEKTTPETITQEVLQYGYYWIEVIAKSTDTDKYLDADFDEKIKDNSLKEFFYVTSQVERPKLYFYYDDESGVYKLDVYKPEFASFCVLTLDDQDLATIPFEAEQEKYVYTFSTTNFPDNEGKPYSIKAVAMIDENGEDILNDKTIFPDSEVSNFNIIRASNPTFEVSKEEILSVTLPDGIDHVEMKQSDVLVNNNLPTYDLKVIKGTQLISFKYIAKEDKYEPIEEKTIYLDSFDKTYTFQRLTSPNALDFNDGKLLFASVDHQYTDKYIITLKLVKKENPTRPYVTEISSKDVKLDEKTSKYSFDLNSYIEEMLSNKVFNTDYSDCIYVLSSIQACSLRDIDGIFYLPSSSSEEYQASKLDNPQITFDTTNLDVKWEEVSTQGETTYTVLVDEEEYEDAKDISGNYYRFTDGDYFLEEKTITVFASNSKYLSSSTSNVITVRRLNPASKIEVTEDGQVSMIIGSQDLNQVANVLVNSTKLNEMEEFGWNKETGLININLNEYQSGEENLYQIAIVYEGRESETLPNCTKYYVSSKSQTYRFYNLEKIENSVTKNLEDNTLQWNIMDSFFFGQSGDPLSYRVEAQDGLGNAVKINVKDENISLEHEKLFALSQNEYTITVFTELATYEMTELENASVGYFGVKQIGQVAVKKLNAFPQDYTIKVVEGSGSDIDKRQNSGIEISWLDLWHKGEESDKSDILFDIDIKSSDPSVDSLIKQYLTNLKDGSKSDFAMSLLNYTYSLNIEKRGQQYYYVLKINSNLAHMLFASGSYTIPIIVHKPGEIQSNTAEIEFMRLANVESADVSNEGELSITNVENANKYIVRIKMGSLLDEVKTIDVQEGQFTKLDLLQIIGDNTGSYSIDILADYQTSDNAQKILPAVSSQKEGRGIVNGYRLMGVQSYEVEDTGNVKLTIADSDQVQENIEFYVYYNGQSFLFEPKRTENNDGRNIVITYDCSLAQFVLLLKDLNIPTVGELKIDVAVKKSGSMNSPLKSITFNYSSMSNLIEQKREKIILDGVASVQDDKFKDFLVINEVEDQTITGVWVEYKYAAEDKEPVDISMSSNHGYWVVFKNGIEKFVQVAPNVEDLYKSYTPCYAVCVNDLLKDLDSGEYNFYVSIYAKDKQGTFIQYEVQQITYYKLDSIERNNASLNESILSWQASLDDKVTSYYVTVYEGEKISDSYIFRKDISSVTSIDLIDIINDTTKTYCVTITPVSDIAGTISGDEKFEIIIGKFKDIDDIYNTEDVKVSLSLQEGSFTFTEPQTLTLSDSQKYQTYWEEIYPFLKIIRENIGNGAELDRELRGQMYVPFTYSMTSLENAYVRLKFVKIEDGVENPNIVYTTSPILAINLIPQKILSLRFASLELQYDERNTINYIEALKQYSGYGYSNIEALLSALEKSTKGYANKSILFDDCGDKIPSGEYMVELRQEGEQINQYSNRGMMPSDYIKVLDHISVTEAPNMQLSSSVVNAVNKYYFTFREIEKMEKTDGGVQKVKAATYKLNIRGKDKIIEYDVLNKINGWTIEYEGQKVEDKDGSIIVYRNGYVTIDLSQISKLPELSDMHNDEFELSVYAVGDDFATNSKTDTILVTILEFDYTAISLQDGIITLPQPAKNSNGIIVTYMTTTMQAASHIIVGANNGTRLELPTEDGGKFNYISFMTNGGIKGNTVLIDSESYQLRNVEMRQQPNIVAVNNQIRVTKASGENSNWNFDSNRAFLISNNKVDNSEYLFITENDYLPGNYNLYNETSLDYKIRKAELTATEFYISAAGNSADNFEVVPGAASYGNTNADHVIVANHEGNVLQTVVLKSVNKTFYAKMLNNVTSSNLIVKIENGDIVWKETKKDKNDSVSQNTSENKDYTLAEGYTIAYRINVYYYANSVSGEKELKDNRSYWTTGNKLPTTLIDVIGDYNDYSISITRRAYKVSKTSRINAIRTIEGTYLYEDSYPSNPAYYNEQVKENRVYVLTSEEELFSANLSRISNKNSDNKDIEIKVDDSSIKLYFNISDLRNYDFKVLDQNGNAIVADAVITDAQGGESAYVTITPKLTYNRGAAYSLRVFMYYKEEQIFDTTDKTTRQQLLLLSYAIEIPQRIYQLQDVSQEDISMSYDIEEDVYTFDLSSYFENYKVLAQSTYTMISVKLGDSDEDFANIHYSNSDEDTAKFQVTFDPEIANQSTFVKLLTGKAEFTFTVKAYNADALTQSNIKLFSSAPTTFTFDVSEFNEGDKVEWDAENKLVKLTSSKDLTGNEFMFVINYLSGDSEKSEIIKTVTREGDLYCVTYQPRTMGVITNFSVYLRSGTYSFFSEPLGPSEFESVELNLFDGGDGTEEKPYLIKDAEQFANMALRNSNGLNYYFKLKNDINLELNSNINSESNPGNAFIINDNFYGHLDGDGKTLNINMTGFGNLSKNITLSMQENNVATIFNINKGSSVFYYIAQDATISNLNININIEAEDIVLKETNNAGVAFTSLAMFNYGTISNIQINSITTTLGLGRESNILIAVGGLVGENHGEMTNCINNADIELPVTSINRYIPYVMYCGMAIKLSRGRISDCFSRGNINVIARKSNSKIWASGIVGYAENSSVITRSGNDSTISMQANPQNATFIAYATGIVICATNSTISYCYNNGNISYTESCSNGNVAGISYYLTNCTVNTIVDTSGLQTVNRFIGGKKGNSYASKPTSELDNFALQVLNPSDNNGLKVEADESGKFTASIV